MHLRRSLVLHNNINTIKTDREHWKRKKKKKLPHPAFRETATNHWQSPVGVVEESACPEYEGFFILQYEELRHYFYIAIILQYTNNASILHDIAVIIKTIAFYCILQLIYYSILFRSFNNILVWWHKQSSNY